MPLNLAYNVLQSTNQNDPVAPFAFELFFGNQWNGQSPYAHRLERLLGDCLDSGVLNQNNRTGIMSAIYGFAGYLFNTEPNEVYPIADAVNLSRQGEASLNGYLDNDYSSLINRLQGGNNRYGNNNGGGRSYSNQGGYGNQHQGNGHNRFGNNQPQTRGYANQRQNSFSNYGGQRQGNGYNRPNFGGTYACEGQFAPNLGAPTQAEAAAGEALIAKKREELRQAQAERQGRQQGYNNQPNVFSANIPEINLNGNKPVHSASTYADFPKPDNLHSVNTRFEMVNEENISAPMGEVVTNENNRWALMEKEIGASVPEEWRNLPWDIRYFAPILYSFKTRKPYWTTKTICGITYLSVGFKKVDEMNRADHDFPTFGAALDNAPAYDITPAVEQLRDFSVHPERYQIEELRKAHDEWKSLAAKTEQEWADWENANKEKPSEEQSEKPAAMPEVPEKVNFIAAKKQMLGYSLDTARNYMFSTGKEYLSEEAINVMSCNYYSYEYVGSFMTKEMVAATRKAFTQLNGINKPVMGKALTPVEFTRILDGVVNNLTNAETGEALDKLFTNIINEMLQYNMGLEVTIDSVLTDAEGNNDLVDLANNVRADRGEAYYQSLGAFQWNLINRLSIMDSNNEITASSAHYLGKLTNHSLVEIVANPLSINCRGITEEAARLAAVCDTEGQHLITEEASPELFAILSRFMPRYNENEFREVEVVIGNVKYKGYLNFLDGNRQSKSNANSFVLAAQ